MKNIIAIVLVLGAVAVSQDQATVGHTRTACGPANVQFDVKTDQNHHPVAQPAPDKAVAYVVENLRAGCFLCDTTTRFGLDGAWVGANKGNSYFFFPLEPGEHHLCAEMQSEPSSSETTCLASFTAEAGKIYYFRARLTDRNNSGKGGVDWALDLEPLDGDEGQFLIASYGYSTYHQKK